ncbi:hypothetical protein LPJ64_001716 [Coemansia asiatica]|uniref:DUF4246 domain-containing protein n=1 Tax=Coemansia asiatica TaxID=1052880 RepID=A0A9W7XQ17_9FUNG|nr:hypothetical protein LPJ64_001716 [Coemansia asiatica]
MSDSSIKSRFSFYNPNHRQYGRSFNDHLKYNNKHGIVFAAKIHTVSTLAERRLQRVSGFLRTQPGWMDLLDDEMTFNKWAREAPDEKLMEVEVQYLADELNRNSDISHHVPMASAWSASPNFSWLPAEFYIAEDGTTRIDSYINNLHPKRHAKLYDLIAQVFSKSVPVFEQVITDAVYTSPPRIREGFVSYYTNVEPMPTDYNSSDYIQKLEQWRADAQHMGPQPDPYAKFDRPIPPQTLRNRRVQIVAKMHNIVLSPEQPEYPGDNEWYVEAMSNERIIATVVCYYDEHNVTQGDIAFRDRLNSKIEYVEGDRQSINLDYGLLKNPRADSEILTKYIGSVNIFQGLCVGFPNLYQCKSSGFKLADPTKPGHRKMLTFYLIDPSIKIPSTEFVPPQQKSWWAERVSKTKPFREMPLIIREQIFDNVNFPISLEKALRIRRKMNEERDAQNRYATGTYFEQKFVFNETS